ncbi:MAG: hypothetical protein L0H70_03410, partial [Xanthomonadales bacterium]|nr:hypothetical protein [Xanthomonadales bacterium]
IPYLNTWRHMFTSITLQAARWAMVRAAGEWWARRICACWRRGHLLRAVLDTAPDARGIL